MTTPANAVIAKCWKTPDSIDYLSKCRPLAQARGLFCMHKKQRTVFNGKYRMRGQPDRWRRRTCRTCRTCRTIALPPVICHAAFRSFPLSTVKKRTSEESFTAHKRRERAHGGCEFASENSGRGKGKKWQRLSNSTHNTLHNNKLCLPTAQ